MVVSFNCYISQAHTHIIDPLSLLLLIDVSFFIAHLFLRSALAVGLGRVVTTGDNEVLRPVVVLAAEVGLEDGLCAGGVAGLGVERGTGHVRDGGVAAALEGAVLCVTERVVLGRGLREPDITTIAAEVAGLERVGDIFLDDDGATGSVDEP